MKLEDALADIEKRFSVHPVKGLTSFAPTGETYVTITSGGEKDEFQPATFFPTLNEAVEKWRDSIKTYAQGKTGTLYWRAMPEIGIAWGKVRGKHRAAPLYSIYSRLLISAKRRL